MLNVSGSMSTNTGRAPTRAMVPGGGEEGVRAGDDFIARADVERHERDQQRIGARGDADAELAARIRRGRGFERLHLRARG